MGRSDVGQDCFIVDLEPNLCPCDETLAYHHLFGVSLLLWVGLISNSEGRSFFLVG